MKYKTRIEVKLKGEQFDPEGEAVKRSLVDLDFPVKQVKIGKIYEITLEANSKKETESLARQMCSRLLANPIKDDFKSEVEEIGGSKLKS